MAYFINMFNKYKHSIIVMIKMLDLTLEFIKMDPTTSAEIVYIKEAWEFDHISSDWKEGLIVTLQKKAI